MFAVQVSCMGVRIHHKRVCSKEWECQFVMLVVELGNHGAPFWTCDTGVNDKTFGCLILGKKKKLVDW